MAATMSPPNSGTYSSTGPSGHSATGQLGHSGPDDDTISATWPPGRSAGPLGLSQLFSVMSGRTHRRGGPKIWGPPRP